MEAAHQALMKLPSDVLHRESVKGVGGINTAAEVRGEVGSGESRGKVGCGCRIRRKRRGRWAVARGTLPLVQNTEAVLL